MIRALLSVYFDRVLISGNGWGIHFGHAPSEPAEIEKLTKPNPLDDKAFFLQVMRIAMEAADGVREAIAKDWGHSPMQPDKDGSAKHPLFGGASPEWYCMHCDTRSSAHWPIRPRNGVCRHTIADWCGIARLTNERPSQRLQIKRSEHRLCCRNGSEADATVQDFLRGNDFGFGSSSTGLNLTGARSTPASP